jgi:putative membrane protein
MKSALTVVLALASTCVWAAGTPTDPQIAAIVVTANQVDIDAGKLAEATTHSAQVKDFAQLMVKDHTGVNEAATALVTKLHVTPRATRPARV